MDDKKKKAVALDDDALDKVSGGTSEFPTMLPDVIKAKVSDEKESENDVNNRIGALMVES